VRQTSTRIRTISLDDASAGALRELALATAYDKASRLDVPVFETGRKKYRLAADDAVYQGCPVPGKDPVLTRVAAAVAQVTMHAARYEPLNDTLAHRPYPSPRGLFPVKADFVFERPAGDIRLRFDPDHLTLHQTDGQVPGHDDFRAVLRVELIADLVQIAPLYGDLAPTLCALEAGHLLQALVAELHAEGLDAQAVISASGQFSGAGSVALCAVRFTASPVVCPGRRHFNHAIRVPQTRLSENDAARLRKAAAHFECASMPPRSIPASALRYGTPSRPGVRPRSSGVFPFGFHGLPVPDAERERLVEALLSKSAFHDPAGGEGWPSVAFLLPQADGDLVVQPAGPGHAAPRRIAGGCAHLAEAYGTAFNINLLTIPVIVALYCDMGEMLAQGSAWRYVQSLVLMGVLAQKYCAVCADFGLAARPFKGMIEDRLEQAAGLSGQTVYTILVGRSSGVNPSLSLGPLCDGEPAASQEAIRT